MNRPSAQRPVASIVWRLDEYDSRDHARLHTLDEGARLCGNAVLVVDGRPTSIDYRVEIDREWRTLGATIEVRSGAGRPRAIEVIADDGHWRFDGVIDSTFDGCLDIDLGWTPATNLLPIRRHDLAIGESVVIGATWLRFPELEFSRSSQRYTRLDQTTWRYESGDFARDLTVNDVGFATAYGDDLWQAVATTD